jgi:hypothetical protein
MNKPVLTIVLLAATAGAARRASAGADAPPAWCSTPGLADYVKMNNYDVDGALKKDNPYFALGDLVIATCSTDPEVQEHRAELDAARAYWTGKLEMTDADWADVAPWAMLTQSERYVILGRLRLADDARKKAWSSYDAFDQYLAIAGAPSRDDVMYLTDAMGDKLSMLGRFAFVEQCLEGANDAPEVRWAICQPDIAALDFGKPAAELHAAKDRDGASRTLIRLDVLRMKDELAAHAAEVKALLAKDEAYGKLFTISDATRAEWAKRANGPLFALALAMDDARVTGSRKAYAGCADTTWAAWTAAVGKLPAKTFEGMRDDPSNGRTFTDQALPQIVADPDAWLASYAYVTCRATDQDRMVYALARYVQDLPGFRGPRTATEMAIGAAKIELDDRNAHLAMPFADRSEWFHVQASNDSGWGRGPVVQAKAAGGKLHVEFVTKMVKQTQCAESRETNHVTQIDADGTVRYQYVCVRSEVVTVDKGADPQDVDPRYAAGVKAGVSVSLLGNVVQAVWAKDGAATPTDVFGVPVK